MGGEVKEALRRLFEIDQHPLRYVSRAPDAGADTLTFEAASGPVRALFVPAAASKPAPAILYLHAHGNRYDIGADEVLTGRPALQGPLGPVFQKMGYSVLCLDMPCFGHRADQTESAAAKAALWQGRSLAGQMLGEQASALRWLAAQPQVDPARIAVFGLSMGATLAYWLAAVCPQISAVAHLCCFADFQPLIETGAHDLHGAYLTIPGLLQEASNGEIAGLIAPRPQFIGLGARDPLTPPDATVPALRAVQRAYRNGPLVVHHEAHTGHEETPEMRAALLGFLRTHLG